MLSFLFQLEGTYHDLLAWAIFAQKEDLASIFWSKCENPLLTAIMASSILNTMAERVNTAKDLNLYNDLLKHSRLFEKRALYLMNSLYEENNKGCMSLVNTEDKVWGIRVAPVECAFDNGMIDVVGHPCVQRLLNRVWYKDSASIWRDWIKSLFCFRDHAAWTSPAMMFLIHYLLMLGILIAYSAFLLSDVKGIKTFGDIGVYELLLYLWITADAIEEIFLKELLQFSWIVFVFIVCAGVMYHSNMYPNHNDMWPKKGAEIEHWRIWKILSLPYWQLYGELSLDVLKGETNSNGTCTFNESEWEKNTDIERCVEYDWAIMVVAAMYMVISNLLLFNLIIALFSYRFEEVQNNSDRLWKYWRFEIIRDYSTRYPVPFNVFLHMFICICKSCSKYIVLRLIEDY
ncbi:unnamed protein product [Mytilus coruscus]|uniref:TRPM-like domain-containing protein n=1 Tax=Mytilus coruscus TaxID=42192 RepID=A0A6J8CSQ8_MYTCO|nr:unnamed protein product [Mytilus coruscus]